MWIIIVKNKGVCNILQEKSCLSWFFYNNQPKQYKHLTAAVKKQRQLSYKYPTSEVWVIESSMFSDDTISSCKAEKIIKEYASKTIMPQVIAEK